MEYPNRTIYELFFRQRNLFVDISMISIGVLFLGILANLRVQLWPVPITGQTFGIFVLAFFFGSRKGVMTVLAYLLLGAIGFGVFAGYASGYGAFLGPTAGYLIGFVPCAFLTGYLIERGYGRTKKSIILVMVLGNLVIYLFGVIGLAGYLGSFDPGFLLMNGVVLFLIGDVIKIIGALALFPFLWEKGERYCRKHNI